jgi:KDO2-lipid IV(A) lauroyltransferase
LTKLVDSSDAGYLLYSILPLDRIYALSRLHGRLTYLVNRRQRRTVRRNLAQIVGATRSGGEIDQLTRRFFEYRRIRGMMQAVAPRLTNAEMAQRLPVEGLDHLDRALEQGRGAILLGTHLNSVSMFNAIVMLRERGYDIGVALPEERDPWAPSRLRRAVSRLTGTKSLRELIGGFYAQFNIRPIVRHLAANGVVAQTGDGLHSARFVEVDFLGRRIPFPTGMAGVAQLTGAPIVPIFQVGAPPDRLRIIIEEPWTVERGDDPAAALTEAVAAFAQRLEYHLLENIACWEHLLIEDTLATMASWPQRPLQERYNV